MKKMFLVIVLSTLLLYGCAGPSAPETPSAPAPAEVPAQVMPAPAAPASSVGGEVREFTMTAKQWEFQPDTVEVNQGDTVKLKITSSDVAHGIALPDFDVNENLEPGNEVIIEFVADKKGEFSFWCNIPCGSGHRDMRGTLIVR
ncbi:TPA: cytochrome c oxidase subunit II [Candidatus Woesearchaeota archaeon]|nr:cytochrome c oxidase subunit II [Candidatus Woesearchaeota archaeon]